MTGVGAEGMSSPSVTVDPCPRARHFDTAECYVEGVGAEGMSSPSVTVDPCPRARHSDSFVRKE